MGGLTSFATTAVQALGAANTVLGAVNNYRSDSGSQAYAQQKALNDLTLQKAQENAALQKEQIRLDTQNAETERRAALKRAMAKQRASYGAEGISSGDGSAQAVLLGLYNESDEERQQRESLDALKNASLDAGVEQQKRLNTLQLSQLKQKNSLNRYTAAADGVLSVLE